MPSAVILTALPLEYLAVRAHLSDVREAVHPQGTVYDRGLFEANGQTWDVGLVDVGIGNERAAAETERAIAYFDPQVVMFVGVAGGIKDVELGDVVIATKVYAYEYGKAGEAFLPRAEVALSSYPLEQRAKQIARDDAWQGRVIPQAVEPPPRAIVAPIAAGAQVVASNQSSTFQYLRTEYSDAAAVEMEGFGFLAAARATSGVLALVVRGISDQIEGKEKSDSEGWQPKAASHAAAFAFEMLARFQTGQPLSLNVQAPQLDAGNLPTPSPQESTFKVRGVAPSRLRSFAGRRAELEQIGEILLQGQPPGPAIMVIHGLSGVGKTQLCREYLGLHQADYRLTCWISAGEPTQSASSLAQLADDLSLPGFDPHDSTKSSRLALQWLKQNDNWLLVFDNASPKILGLYCHRVRTDIY
jgi:nucleoside phosphorylase